MFESCPVGEHPATHEGCLLLALSLTVKANMEPRTENGLPKEGSSLTGLRNSLGKVLGWILCDVLGVRKCSDVFFKPRPAQENIKDLLGTLLLSRRGSKSAKLGSPKTS